MNFYQWILNKIRMRRFSTGVGLATKLYTFGTIVEGHYRNYKHDQNPLVWVQYSDARYTHGININYLNQADKMWLIKTIYMIKKYGQGMDGRTFYQMLKQQRMSIVKTAYRVYFTNQCEYKMVSAGITNMDKMCYTTRNNFVNMLNYQIAPREITKSPTQVAYSSEELRNRIIEAQNTRAITSATVAGTRSATGPATY